ncbi:MAG: GspH/FimT family pseudopilin [Arenicellales bacterium]
MTNQLRISEKSTGFTLIELIVTLTVAAILMAAAAPSFRELIQSNRLTASVNELSGSINMARSEAVKRGRRVVVCKSSNGNDCVTTSSTFWQQGWIIFVDDNNDAVHDAGEELLRVHDALERNVTLTGNGNVANYISYISEGRAQLTDGTSQSGTINACLYCADLCKQDPPWEGRDLELTFAGRLDINGGTCTCTCP